MLQAFIEGRDDVIESERLGSIIPAARSRAADRVVKRTYSGVQAPKITKAT